MPEGLEDPQEGTSWGERPRGRDHLAADRLWIISLEPVIAASYPIDAPDQDGGDPHHEEDCEHHLH